MYLRLFGPPVLLASDEPGAAILLSPGKPAAVLAYLACAASRSATRDQLLDLLWSNADPDRGRQSLRQALSQLRRVLGPARIETVGDLVRLRDALASDVTRLEAALSTGAPLEALGLAARPFLSDFATPGGAAFERWASATRGRYDASVGHAREIVARAQLEAGRFQEARETARLALDASPDREAPWRLLLEILLAANDRLGASLEVSALERWLSDEEREPDPATRRLLQRARRLGTDAVSIDAARARPGVPQTLLVPELVGREREFARLLGAWSEARMRGLVRVHVSGVAGIGKSRLVDDVRQRLRAAGVPVPLVRAHPGTRRLPAVLLADVAAALAHLPGALGVSPASAAALVELAPTLADVYRAVPAAPSGSGPDAERRWLQAFERLVVSVAEERPLALVLEDLHWADDLSTRVLLGAFERLTSSRILIVTTARAGTATAWMPDPPRPNDGRGSAFAGAVDRAGRTGLLELMPLAHRDVDAFVRSIAALPEASWQETLMHALVPASRGVPLDLLELLALLVERGLLTVAPDGWQIASFEGASEVACALLTEHAGTGARVAALDDEMLRVLGALALDGAPLDTVAVAAGAERPATWTETHLLTLAHRGLARVAEDGGWEPAHEEIREAALARLPDELRVALGRALGEHFMSRERSHPDGSGVLFARAASAFAFGKADDRVLAVFARWSAMRRSRGDRRSDDELAQVLLGGSMSVERVRAMLATRPPWVRLGLRPRHVSGVLLGALLLAVGVGAGRAVEERGSHVAARPARLALVTSPLGWHVGMPMTPMPIVEIQGADGEPVLSAGDSVHVEAIGNAAIVTSPNAAVVQHGRASFERVLLAQADVGKGPLFARFSYPGVASLVVPLAGNEIAPDTSARLYLVRGTVNGQPLTDGHRLAVAAPGETLAVELDLHYTSPWPAANVVMGAALSWGDPATTWIRVASLVTPARDFALHTRIPLTAPDVPGRYHVMIAFDAEENVSYVLSGTNWSVGRPIWGDGNDVAAWSDAQRATADSLGWVATAMVFPRRGGPASGVAAPLAARDLTRVPRRVGATTLTIEVRR